MHRSHAAGAFSSADQIVGGPIAMGEPKNVNRYYRSAWENDAGDWGSLPLASGTPFAFPQTQQTGRLLLPGGLN
jgi:hypothetical protein